MATGNPQDPWPADLRTFAISRRSPLARRQDLAQVDVARPTGLLVYLQSSYAPIPRRERFFPPRDHHQPRHAPGVEPEARDVAQGARTSGRFARRVDRSGRGELRRPTPRPPSGGRRSRPARAVRTCAPESCASGIGDTPRHARARPRGRVRRLTVDDWLAHRRAHGEAARRARLVPLVRRIVRWGSAARRARANPAGAPPGALIGWQGLASAAK